MSRNTTDPDDRRAELAGMGFSCSQVKEMIYTTTPPELWIGENEEDTFRHEGGE